MRNLAERFETEAHEFRRQGLKLYAELACVPGQEKLGIWRLRPRSAATEDFWKTFEHLSLCVIRALDISAIPYPKPAGVEPTRSDPSELIGLDEANPATSAWLNYLRTEAVANGSILFLPQASGGTFPDVWDSSRAQCAIAAQQRIHVADASPIQHAGYSGDLSGIIPEGLLSTIGTSAISDSTKKFLEALPLEHHEFGAAPLVHSDAIQKALLDCNIVASPAAGAALNALAETLASLSDIDAGPPLDSISIGLIAAGWSSDGADFGRPAALFHAAATELQEAIAALTWPGATPAAIPADSQKVPEQLRELREDRSEPVVVDPKGNFIDLVNRYVTSVNLNAAATVPQQDAGDEELLEWGRDCCTRVFNLKAAILVAEILPDHPRDYEGLLTEARDIIIESLGTAEFGFMPKTELRICLDRRCEHWIQVVRSILATSTPKESSASLMSPQEPEPRRGAPVKIPMERKIRALAVKDGGGSYKDAAKVLYDTLRPTSQQVKNASKHIARLRNPVASRVQRPKATE